MIRNLQMRTKRWITVLAALLVAAAFVIALLFLIGAGYLEWHAEDANDAHVDTRMKSFITGSRADVVELRPTTKPQYSGSQTSEGRAA